MRRHVLLGIFLTCHFFLAVLSVSPMVARAQASVGTPFPLAINFASFGAAFDGTNWLVAMESGSHMASVAGQLISQNGTAVGSMIALGGTGQTCCNAAAFDGTNYLMVWEDDALSSTFSGRSYFASKGQFISKAGVVLGQPFAITGADVWLDGVRFLAFGGGKYLFTYYNKLGYVAGRIISPDGTVGGELRISTGSGSGSSIAFDGANFLVVWSWGSDVRGRFVSPAGVLGQEFSINSSPASSDNAIHVAYDGTNYLVVFHDIDNGTTWDIYGQLVSPTGSLVGGVITVATGAGTQMAMGLAFDGTNYLTGWTDFQATTNWVYGRFIGKSGALVGDKFAISTNSGAQFGAVVGFANGNYLAVANGGAQLGPNGLSMSGGSTTGVFVGTYQQPVAPPPNDQTPYTVTTGQLPAAAVAVEATGTLEHATVTVTLDLSKVLSGGSLAWQGQFAAGYNVYVVALVPAGTLGLPTATLFQLPASGTWTALSSPMAAYREGLAQNAADLVQITILQDANVTALVGTEIYVGYGTSDSEMLEKGQYRGVYIVR